MKLYLLTLACRACDAVSRLLHGCERIVQRVHVAAWTASTKENARLLNQRRVSRISVS